MLGGNELSHKSPDLSLEVTMGSYYPGDVLLVPVRMGRRAAGKVRPVVVIGTGDQGFLLVCPVSSRPPAGAPALPLGLDDFAEGGLDLFGESYLLPSHACRVPAREVVGKKGRLSPGAVERILQGSGRRERR
ncbi:MAG: type II toxin-antitoxin system PemK/MazF family toxin [Methanoregulaceae archaeon]